MPRSGIFLNYRQNGFTGDKRRRLPHVLIVEALADRFRRHFGRDAVFVDTGLRVGAHYPAELRAKLKGSEVLVVVIHDTWLADLDDRRGRAEADWVQDEIAQALDARMTVVPLLIDDAELPAKDQLPDRIGDLVYPQAHRIRFGHWERDVRLLIQALENHVAPVEVIEREVPRVPEPRPWVQVAAAFVLGVLALVLPMVLLVDGGDERRYWLGGVGGLGLLALFFAVLVNGGVYLYRQQLDVLDANAATLANDLKSTVTIGVAVGGLVIVVLFTSDLVEPVALMAALAVLCLLGITFGTRWVLDLRKAYDWPQPLLEVHPADLRRAVYRLDRHITEHQPLLDRLQRDRALFALEQIEETASLLAALHARGRLAWQRATVPYCWLHPALLGITTGGLVGAMPGGMNALAALVIVAVVTLAVGGCSWCALELAYRQQRWRKGMVLAAVAAATTDLRNRLTESSIPPAADSSAAAQADERTP